MSREHQQMRVRLPPDLKDNLEQLATKNGRSMNAEIVYRLQQSLEHDQNRMGLQQMDFKVMDPSIGKGPQKVVNALEEMQRILNEALGVLEDDDQDEDGKGNKD